MPHASAFLAQWFDLGSPQLVNLLPAAGLALIVAGLLMTWRARRRRNVSRLTAREELERLRQKDGVRGDLEQLMVEIEQLAKRMGAQLDAKSIELESLLRKADERLAELRRLANGAPPTPTKPGGERSEPPAPPETHGIPGTSAPGNSTDPATSENPDPLARRVCDLAAQGLTPVDIARKLDEHVGKVELILALHRH